MKNWIGTVVSGLKRSATCTVPGAISFNSCTPFTARCGIVDREAGDVAARMRKVRSEAAADRIRYGREHDGNRPRLAGKGADHGRGHTEDRIGPQADQLFCRKSSFYPASPALQRTSIRRLLPSVHPQLRERTSERCEPRLRNAIALRIPH